MRFANLCICIILILTSCKEEDQSVLTSPYLNHSPDVQYVGKEKCKTCHADKYKSFVQSEMGLSFKLATASNSVADFEHPGVYDTSSDLMYKPIRKGEDLFIMEFRVKGKDTLHKRIEKIDYIVGSGQHTNSHIFEENGYLHQMPLTWYSQKSKWGLPPGFEEGHNTRFSRQIELECMSCHNAMPDHVQNSGNKFLEIPHGIDCERCHGPGEKHIELKMKGELVDTSIDTDYSIVNPGKLSIELQFDVCQRCHLQGTAVPGNPSSFTDFRPGMKLSDHINVFMPRYKDSVEHFIMASHPDRLRMSKCFVKTHDQETKYPPMTCTSCHNPHLPVKQLGLDGYNRQCQNCHVREQDLLCSEVEEIRLTKDNNCFGCHMPLSGSKDIPHVSITDHFIRVPKKEEGKSDVNAQKNFLQLLCLTQKNPSALLMAKGYMTHYEQFENEIHFLDSANTYMTIALQSATPIDFPEAYVRLLYLRNEYQKLTAFYHEELFSTISDPWTFYRTGEAFAQTGNNKMAKHCFKIAVMQAPDHLKFRNKLAGHLIKMHVYDEALVLLDSLLLDYPKYASAWNNRGFAKVLDGHMKDAESDFIAGIKLNPDFELALANLASLYLNTNRKPKARLIAKRLIELSPEKNQYRDFLKLME